MPAPRKGINLRNNRITLMVPVEVLEGVIALAQISDNSVNDLICNMLAESVEKNADAIARFKQSKKAAQELIKPVTHEITVAENKSNFDDNGD